MMQDYSVSVIVPAYNSKKYISQCLDSLVNQTLTSLEIIVVNDGSTDGTLEIIQEYTKKYNNIILVNQENGGISKARTSGYLASHGKYIGWVDNDDFVELNMFEVLFNKAEAENADYVYCDYDFYPQKVATKEKWFKKYNGVINWNFIERNTHPWNKLVRRDLCERIKMAELLPVFSDSVYIGLLLHAKKIVCIDDILYHYRVGHASVSGSYKGKVQYFKEVSDRAKMQKSFLEGTKYKETLDEYFNYRYIYSLIQLCIVATINDSKKDYIVTCKKLRKLNYHKNKYLLLVLKNNYGLLKALVIAYMIPCNYYLSSVVCKVAFKA